MIVFLAVGVGIKFISGKDFVRKYVCPYKSRSFKERDFVFTVTGWNVFTHV